MKVIVTENYEEMSKVASDILIDIVKKNPCAVLGLATGSSPIGTYQNMAKDHKENGTSWQIDGYGQDGKYGQNNVGLVHDVGM